MIESGDPGRSDAALDYGDVASEYAALTGAVGVADFTTRTQIELSGADRASFLHNLCTNEIRRLPAGAGCEAFLTDAHGHVLAFVYVFCTADSLVLETVAGEEQRLLAHLDRYLIREKVELCPRSADWAELLVAGPRSGRLLSQAFALPGQATATIPQALLDHVSLPFNDAHAYVRRVDMTQPLAYLVAVPRPLVADVWERLLAAGAAPCGSTAVEMARIEAGTPYYGFDITDKNLPQEVARDARAISFVKGCYIGQETVARIDAVGHVNRTLVGVRFTGRSVPPRGTELTAADGRTVGHVTSAALSPRFDAPFGLAYVRRGANAPGSKLESPLGPAEVVSLPA
ncbi:MAG: aminomethyl transferase family protein [Planctomycetia bacterium]|nr:aminomethyl transferase family protein [Planctomycetia bacterium]